MVVARATVLGFPPASVLSPWELAKILISSVYDLLYLTGLTAPFVAGLFALGQWPRTRRVVAAFYALLAVGSLLASLANVAVVPMLGRPFNWQWFTYSGYLRSLDARQAMRDALAPRAVGRAAAAVMFLLGGGFSLGYAWARFGKPRRYAWERPWYRQPGKAIPVASAALLYFAASHRFLVSEQWPYEKTANPVVAFAESVVSAGRSRSLFTMKTGVGAEDVLPAGERGTTSTQPSTRPAAFAAPAGAPPLRNVVLFVLESVPAEYLDPYGSAYRATPRLDRARAHSALFTRAYAPAPATNYAMVSMLCSVYPRLSYVSVTQDRPAIDLPSLSGELKSRGYATGFFYSADLAFQRTGEFLSHRGFDRVMDRRTIPRRGGASSTLSKAGRDPWLFAADFADDADTAAALTDWITEQSRAGRPFFGMLWTGMTHYPYAMPPGEPIDFGVGDKKFNLYLNALYHGDAALGALLDALDRGGLSDSTLVVVIGDHGEAFGRHRQFGHATAIYEENVHIPLLLINPKWFKGETFDAVGGTLDVAPTVLGLLGFPAPPRWQGRSLFDGDRPGRAYFFAPWSEYAFGLRDGDRKLIYNATKNQFEAYDLAADPQEAENLAGHLSESIDAAQQRFAAWAQYEGRFYRETPDLK
jgi:arylsulfatase A-like enzyme